MRSQISFLCFRNNEEKTSLLWVDLYQDKSNQITLMHQLTKKVLQHWLLWKEFPHQLRCLRPLPGQEWWRVLKGEGKPGQQSRVFPCHPNPPTLQLQTDCFASICWWKCESLTSKGIILIPFFVSCWAGRFNSCTKLILYQVYTTYGDVFQLFSVQLLWNYIQGRSTNQSYYSLIWVSSIF